MKRKLVAWAIFYALCIALVSMFWQRPITLSLCFVAITVFMVSKWHEKSDLTFYFTAFVLGPIGEALAAYFGAWEYSKPIYLIPIWLPLLWGIFGMFLKKLCDTLVTKESNSVVVTPTVTALKGSSTGPSSRVTGASFRRSD
jgi:hypothetical protein